MLDGAVLNALADPRRRAILRLERDAERAPQARSEGLRELRRGSVSSGADALEDLKEVVESGALHDARSNP